MQYSHSRLLIVCLLIYRHQQIYLSLTLIQCDPILTNCNGKDRISREGPLYMFWVDTTYPLQLTTAVAIY